MVLGVLLLKHINFSPVLDDVFFLDGLCAIMLVYQFYLLFGFCSRGYKFEDLLNRLNVFLHSCKFILMVLSNEIGWCSILVRYIFLWDSSLSSFVPSLNLQFLE